MMGCESNEPQTVSAYRAVAVRAEADVAMNQDVTGPVTSIMGAYNAAAPADRVREATDPGVQFVFNSHRQQHPTNCVELEKERLHESD